MDLGLVAAFDIEVAIDRLRPSRRLGGLSFVLDGYDSAWLAAPI